VKTKNVNYAYSANNFISKTNLPAEFLPTIRNKYSIAKQFIRLVLITLVTTQAISYVQ